MVSLHVHVVLIVQRYNIFLCAWTFCSQTGKSGKLYMLRHIRCRSYIKQCYGLLVPRKSLWFFAVNYTTEWQLGDSIELIEKTPGYKPADRLFIRHTQKGYFLFIRLTCDAIKVWSDLLYQKKLLKLIKLALSSVNILSMNICTCIWIL